MADERGTPRRSRISGLGWLLLALAVGLGVAWLDARPTWDATGLTAVLLLAASALIGLARPNLAGATGLAIGLPIPLVELGLRPAQPNVASLLAVAVALLGGLGGALLRLALSHTEAG
jgi:hypothetical protein